MASNNLENTFFKENSNHFFSSDLDILSEKILQALFFEAEDPLKIRIVIVPSSQSPLKSYLIDKALRHEKISSFACIQFLSAGEAVHYLWNLAGNKKHLTTEDEFYFYILGEIAELDNQTYPELKSYVDEKPQNAYEIAQVLARLFHQYQIYGQTFHDAHPWQLKLLDELIKKHGLLTPQAAFSQPLILSTEIEMHFFNLPYLSPLYFDYFQRLPKEIACFHYHFSPCSTFWEEMLTHRETKRLELKLKKKINQDVLDLKSEQEKSHPLLANFGKLGREYLHVLDRYTFNSMDYYKPSNPETLLGALQNSLLEDRACETSLPDSSIQLIKAGASKLREVEIARDVLSEMLSKDSTLDYRDILVLSPDIYDYAPYITHVFSDSPIIYKMEGLDVKQSFIIQGFFDLLKLIQSNWSTKDIFSLLENPVFQKRNRFSQEDIETIREWTEQARVRFGFDQAAIDQETHLIDRSVFYPHTWERGFEKMLLGLSFVIRDEKKYLEKYPHPVEGIDFSHADLCEKFYTLLQNLNRDIHEIKAAGKLSLCKWAEILSNLVDQYFEEDPNQKYASQTLRNTIFELQFLQNDASFDFVSVLQYLKKKISTRKGGKNLNELNAITFRSMNEDAIIPKRIIYLLGVQDEKFPRKNPHLSLQILKNYYPTPLDLDRFLFLQLLHAAKKKLLFSYLNISSEDGKEAGFSIAISELLSFLAKMTGLKKEALEEVLTRSYSYSPIERGLFSLDSKTPSYDIEIYHAISNQKTHDKLEKLIFKKPQFAYEPFDCLNVKELFSFAKDPISYFIKQTLGIYLEYDKNDGEEFSLSPLQKYLMKQESMNKEIEDVLDLEMKKDHFPLGMFKDIEKEEFEKNQKLFLKNLNKAGFSLNSIQNLEMTPPLQSCVCKTALHGVLPQTLPDGILVQSEYQFKEWFKLWPQLLVYLSFHKKKEINVYFIQKRLSKKNIQLENPEKHLAKYVELFHLAQKSPAPLLSDWLEGLVRSDEQLFNEQYKKVQHTEQYQNRYGMWAFRNQKMTDQITLFQDWSPYLSEVFEGVIQNGF